MTMKRHATMKRQAMRMFSLLLAVVLLLGAAWAVPGLTASAAEGVTSLEFAEHGLMAWRDGWVYVYGGKGEPYGDTRASDCAGLLYAFFTDHGIYSCMGGASSQVRLNTIWHGSLDELPRIHGLSVTMMDPYDYQYPYGHVGIYVGNGMVTDNSTYGTNMVYDSVYSRGWSEWHLFDCGLLFPVNGWYEFDGNMYHYTDYQYDVDTVVDGYTIGSDGIAYNDDGTPLAYSDTLQNEGYVNAATVRDYLKAQGIGYEVGAGYGGGNGGGSDSHTNARVTGSGVNVRSQPNTQSSILTTLSYGTQILVTGQEEGQNIVSGGQSSTLWYEIVLPSNGATGYISSLYVEITGDLDMPDTPVISYEDGYVTMTANSEEETIYYTTDNTTPTEDSTPYTGPIYMVGLTYRAVSILDGQKSGEAMATVLSNGAIFTDFTSEDWFFEDVDRAVGYGIFGGSGNGSFEPTENISRGDFVKALANMDGVDLSGYTGETAFQDVDPAVYYAKAIQWANSMGYINGVSATAFEPEEPISREAMCVILMKYGNLSSSNSGTFADDSEISSWAREAVYACRDAGLISGVGNDRFDPQGYTERAAACKVFANYYERY